MTPRASLAALWLLVLSARCDTASSLGRTVKTVKLPGGHMEIVQEEACSDSLLRLTCRSLRAFIFVLEAEYRSEDTQACGYDLAAVRRRYDTDRRRTTIEAPRAHAPVVLRGNYIEDDDEAEAATVDLRNSLNKR